MRGEGAEGRERGTGRERYGFLDHQYTHTHTHTHTQSYKEAGERSPSVCQLTGPKFGTSSKKKKNGCSR